MNGNDRRGIVCPFWSLHPGRKSKRKVQPLLQLMPTMSNQSTTLVTSGFSKHRYKLLHYNIILAVIEVVCVYTHTHTKKKKKKKILSMNDPQPQDFHFLVILAVFFFFFFFFFFLIN